MENSSTAAAPAKKKSRKFLIGALITIFVIAALFGTHFYMHHNMLKSIEAKIDEESKKYSDPAYAKTIITDMANEIISSRSRKKTVKDYAKNNKVSFEEALVDFSINSATVTGLLSKI